jgi:response regulator RpfG family c-di-GMP phosphodiesterase
LGLWLDHRLVIASARSRSEHDQCAPESVSDGTAVAASQSDISSASNSVTRQDALVSGIHAMTFLWIATLQTVVAYLFLTRTQEESTRRQTETERVSLQRHNELLRTRDAVIFGLAGLADCRDPETGRHLERIATYSTHLASTLARKPSYREQITPSFVKLIGISSALHDVGKVGIRDAILLKPGKFDERERILIQSHANIGGECVQNIESRLGDANFLQMARDIALYHHERWDGTGYPKKLAGQEIPLAARIVAIADVYDALSTRRVYKEAFPHEECVEVIRDQAGKAFDPAIVGVFLELESEFRDIAQTCRDASEAVITEKARTEEPTDGAAADVVSSDDDLSALLEFLGQLSAELSAASHPSTYGARQVASSNCRLNNLPLTSAAVSGSSSNNSEGEHVS